MKKTNRFIAYILAFVITYVSLPLAGSPVVTANTDYSNNGLNASELIDIDIYKAQCLAGIAYDPNSDAVEHCRDLYNYYINEELFSPTQTFLDAAYADETLRMNFNEWKEYIGLDASTALEQPLKKKDYYESLIIALFSQSLDENNDIIKDIKINAAATATNVIDNLCTAAGVTTKAALISYFPNTTASTAKSALQDALFGTEIASDALFVIDIVLDASSTIIDAVERIALYNEMLNLDAFTKQWIEQMYNSCDEETDTALKIALYNLKSSSSSFAESLLVQINDSAFRVRTWAAGTTIDITLDALCASNPISAAVLVGLKLGKTICDIFYKTSDVYEQFYMLECIYNVENLSREVVESCEIDFIQNVTSETAKTFIYALNCHFECLINVEVQCMIEFLDLLYNGGILMGTIKWWYGAIDDYQEAVNVLESLRDTRQNNYDLMTIYFKIALEVNYPDTYDYYFPASFLSLDRMPIVDHGSYQGNLGDSTIFNLNGQGLSRNDKGEFFNGYGNVGIDGTTYTSGFEAWIARWNYTKEISWAYATFDIGGKYETLTGKTNLIGSYNTTNFDTTVYFYDGETLLASYNLTPSDYIKDINVNVEGVTQLKLLVKDNVAVAGGTSFALYDMFLNGSKIEGGEIQEITTWFSYIVDENNNATITGLIDGYQSSNLTIPSKIQNYSVIGIGDSAFQYCDSLTSITIPDSVTNIDESAFSSCNELTTVYYQGKQSDWDKITIGSGNEDLTNAEIIFAVEIVYGDANGDGQIGMDDVVCIRQYITNFDYDANTSGENVEAGADINGDSVVNMKDVILLRQYIASYNYETGSSTVVLGPQQ